MIGSNKNLNTQGTRHKVLLFLHELDSLMEYIMQHISTDLNGTSIFALKVAQT